MCHASGQGEAKRNLVDSGGYAVEGRIKTRVHDKERRANVPDGQMPPGKKEQGKRKKRIEEEKRKKNEERRMKKDEMTNM
jgi:hypothetical protein